MTTIFTEGNRKVARIDGTTETASLHFSIICFLRLGKNSALIFHLLHFQKYQCNVLSKKEANMEEKD